MEKRRQEPAVKDNWTYVTYSMKSIAYLGILELEVNAGTCTYEECGVSFCVCVCTAIMFQVQYCNSSVSIH